MEGCGIYCLEDSGGDRGREFNRSRKTRGVGIFGKMNLDSGMTSSGLNMLE